MLQYLLICLALFAAAVIGGLVVGLAYHYVFMPATALKNYWRGQDDAKQDQSWRSADMTQRNYPLAWPSPRHVDN